MALSELYISPGRVERGGRGAMWGRRLTMNLGPQIFAWGKRKKEKKKKKPLLLMELVNICCCVLGPVPQGALEEGKTGK